MLCPGGSTRTDTVLVLRELSEHQEGSQTMKQRNKTRKGRSKCDSGEPVRSLATP